ncbi:hypothetical protein D9758_000686 [Tetrapyrgos nigripes]|uniref:gamma-glutamylcyclotransferase n=1 Tax=Tetrapyrgos nigripes TaxID=182062 RepID=A0A8H5LY96_9AGAR|nr:hypothetical protein D9758_000686 [Tetrapyrgos nigripes]
MSQSTLNQTVHFSYGSNIWMDQMKARCPSSRYLGVAILRGWRWIIHTFGYANLVPSPSDHVYGFLYELSPEDEKILDVYEGVPRDYHKEILYIEIVRRAGVEEGVHDGVEMVDALIYIDSETVQDGTIRKEYIPRLKFASRDGIKEGIPAEYFEKYWQRFIPSNLQSTEALGPVIDGSGSRSSDLTLNFSYGSNIWKEQMATRCPRSCFKGVALLRGWRWLINERGYANVVPSTGDHHVYGFLYELDAEDEATLDGYEGVPSSYQKEMHSVEIINGEACGELIGGKRFVDALVYVDSVRTSNGTIKEEYIRRMSLAMEDALKEGFPKQYIETYIHPFLEGQT